MCGRSSSRFLLALSLALALSITAVFAAEPIPGPNSIPSSPSSESAPQKVHGLMDSLSELTQTLVDESTALASESDQHAQAQIADQKRLQELEIEAEELRNSRESFKTMWQNSTASSQRAASLSESSLKEASDQIDRLTKERDSWKLLGEIGTVAAVAGWVAFALSFFL